MEAEVVVVRNSYSRACGQNQILTVSTPVSLISQLTDLNGLSVDNLGHRVVTHATQATALEYIVRNVVANLADSNDDVTTLNRTNESIETLHILNSRSMSTISPEFRSRTRSELLIESTTVIANLLSIELTLNLPSVDLVSSEVLISKSQSVLLTTVATYLPYLHSVCTTVVGVAECVSLSTRVESLSVRYIVSIELSILLRSARIGEVERYTILSQVGGLSITLEVASEARIHSQVVTTVLHKVGELDTPILTLYEVDRHILDVVVLIQNGVTSLLDRSVHVNLSNRIIRGLSSEISLRNVILLIILVPVSSIVVSHLTSSPQELTSGDVQTYIDRISIDTVTRYELHIGIDGLSRLTVRTNTGDVLNVTLVSLRSRNRTVDIGVSISVVRATENPEQNVLLLSQDVVQAKEGDARIVRGSTNPTSVANITSECTIVSLCELDVLQNSLLKSQTTSLIGSLKLLHICSLIIELVVHADVTLSTQITRIHLQHVHLIELSLRELQLLTGLVAIRMNLVKDVTLHL